MYVPIEVASTRKPDFCIPGNDCPIGACNLCVYREENFTSKHARMSRKTNALVYSATRSPKFHFFHQILSLFTSIVWYGEKLNFCTHLVDMSFSWCWRKEGWMLLESIRSTNRSQMTHLLGIELRYDFKSNPGTTLKEERGAPPWVPPQSVLKKIYSFCL